MLIDLVIMIVPWHQSERADAPLVADWKHNPCHRAAFLNARAYVMTQCKGDAGTFLPPQATVQRLHCLPALPSALAVRAA